MNQASRRAGQFALATALAVTAYHMSVFGVFFLLPLQWVRIRLGQAPFVASSALALAGVVGVQAVIKAILHLSWSTVDALALVLPVALVVGWVGIVLLERTGWRFLYRTLAMTAVAALMLFPLAASLLGNEGFMKSLSSAFDAVWDQVFQTPGIDTSMTAGLNRDEFFELLKQAFLDSFLLVFFLFWMFTGRLAKLLERVRPPALQEFRVPPQGAWVLLVLWGLLLGQLLAHQGGGSWNWGFWQYVVLNSALIALVVHAVAGLGIVEALMTRWKWPVFGRVAVRAALILLLFAQGAGQLVVLVGLPLLSVLELWVNLRVRQEVGQ